RDELPLTPALWTVAEIPLALSSACSRAGHAALLPTPQPAVLLPPKATIRTDWAWVSLQVAATSAAAPSIAQIAKRSGRVAILKGGLMGDPRAKRRLAL